MGVSLAASVGSSFEDRHCGHISQNVLGAFSENVAEGFLWWIVFGGGR